MLLFSRQLVSKHLPILCLYHLKTVACKSILVVSKLGSHHDQWEVYWSRHRKVANHLLQAHWTELSHMALLKPKGFWEM